MTSHSQQHICSMRPQNLKICWCCTWREFAAWLETGFRYRRSKRQGRKKEALSSCAVCRAWLQTHDTPLCFCWSYSCTGWVRFTTFCCNPAWDSVTNRKGGFVFCFCIFKDVYIWSLKAKICKLMERLKDLCYRLWDAERLQQMLLCYAPLKKRWNSGWNLT